MRERSIFLVLGLMTAPVAAQVALVESADYPSLLPGPSNAHPGTGCFMLASGTIVPGDVDWLELTIPFASAETIIDIDFIEDGSTSILLISEEGGRTVLANGDSNNSDDNTCGLGSASDPIGGMHDSVVFLPNTLANAVIHIGVTGGGDWGFTGAHNHNFSYEIWVYATGEVAGGGCTSDADCDDSVDCTADVCDVAAGTCSNVADNSACDNGWYCDGVEVCDPVNDCVAGDVPCGNGDVCSEVAEECIAPVGVVMDIKPGSCPNKINRKSKGVMQVALFGSSDFDVELVDISSLVLTRADGVGGWVSPNEGPPGPHTKVKDIGAAGLLADDAEDCACRESSSKEDGLMDLVMKFRTADVMEQLELDEFDHGTQVELLLSGYMDGVGEFTASDCVRVLPWKKKHHREGRHDDRRSERHGESRRGRHGGRH